VKDSKKIGKKLKIGFTVSKRRKINICVTEDVSTQIVQYLLKNQRPSKWRLEVSTKESPCTMNLTLRISSHLRICLFRLILKQDLMPKCKPVLSKWEVMLIRPVFKATVYQFRLLRSTGRVPSSRHFMMMEQGSKWPVKLILRYVNQRLLWRNRRGCRLRSQGLLLISIKTTGLKQLSSKELLNLRLPSVICHTKKLKPMMRMNL
jgi:hypothetical protein